LRFQESSLPPSNKPAKRVKTGDLQKEVQNPVASLISVPLQNNMNFGIGPLDRTQNVLKSSR